jgi:hypothetical protein
MIAAMRTSASLAVDCPMAPASRSDTYARALHRACVIVGGVGQLAAQLKVPEADLRRWLKCEGDPPLDVFLATVEILLLSADEAGRA